MIDEGKEKPFQKATLTEMQVTKVIENTSEVNFRNKLSDTEEVRTSQLENENAQNRQLISVVCQAQLILITCVK